MGVNDIIIYQNQGEPMRHHSDSGGGYLTGGPSKTICWGYGFLRVVDIKQEVEITFPVSRWGLVWIALAFIVTAIQGRNQPTPR